MPQAQSGNTRPNVSGILRGYMLTTFERTVSFTGNLVAIITLVLGVLNWLGMNIALDSHIPNQRIALMILIGYVFFASYGQGIFLLYLAKHDSPILMAWALSTFSYAFGFLFLLDKCILAVQWDSESDAIAIINASLGNNIIFQLTFISKMIYPDGLSMKAWFVNGFKPSTFKWVLAAFGHFIILLLSLRALRGS